MGVGGWGGWVVYVGEEETMAGQWTIDGHHAIDECMKTEPRSVA